MRGGFVSTIVVALGIAFAGCGGSASDSTSASTADTTADGAQTKERWISEADAICTEGKAALDPLQEEYGELQDEDETPRVLVAVADVLRRASDATSEYGDRLRALTPPPGDETIVDEMLDGIEKTSELDSSLADAIEEGNRLEVRDLADELTTNSAKDKGIAQGYGLQVCGADDD